MSEAVIALGANLGDREKNLGKALLALNKLEGTTIKKVSSIYETKPFGVLNKQDDYLNCCVLIETSLEASFLMGACLGIESALGRERSYKNAPRIIDIDLLLYEDLKLETKNLILPHPRIKERGFVMVPMNDILDNKRFFDFDFSLAFEKINFSELKKFKK